MNVPVLDSRIYDNYSLVYNVRVRGGLMKASSHTRQGPHQLGPQCGPLLGHMWA